MKYLLTIINLTFSIIMFGQNNFTLGLLLPEPSSNINETGISRLENKMISLVNKSDAFSYGYTNDFVLSPIVDVGESGLVQGGLENLAVTKVEITFLIKQISTGKTYGTISKTYKGSGKNQNSAITNSFSQINPTDKSIHQFLSESKEKIEKYYSENCSKIIQNAINIAKSGDYEQSISLLQSIPDTGNNCFASAQQSSLNYYKLYQKKLCSNNLTKAKSEIALNNFDNAVYYLQFIDNESACYKEAENLINQISSKITKKENQEFDLESKRINAIKEIGKAYYSNQAKTLNYTVIVR